MARTWAKSPAEHVQAFADALPADPRVERRQMFGYPCGFVNGHLFCGLHEHNICVRLGVDGAAERIAQSRAQVFAPMAGRVMREYVAIPAADCADAQRLRPWLAEGFAYAAALPQKPASKAARKPAQKPARKPAQKPAPKPAPARRVPASKKGA